LRRKNGPAPFTVHAGKKEQGAEPAESAPHLNGVSAGAYAVAQLRSSSASGVYAHLKYMVDANATGCLNARQKVVLNE